jgi:hypothetical protein
VEVRYESLTEANLEPVKIDELQLWVAVAPS